MKARLIFLLRYFVFWLLFFQLARMCFLIYHADETKKLPFADIAGSLWYGSRMDLSLAAYIILPVMVFVAISAWVRFFRLIHFYLAYTFLITVVLLLIILSDLELYSQWGFRIDDTPLRFLSSPREVWASISHLPMWLIIPGYLVLCVLAYFIVRWWLRLDLPFPVADRKIVTTASIIVLIPLLIIPIRGGFQLSPMNQSAVYFSRNNFANIAAINAGWNFMHGVMSGSGNQKNPYEYFSAEEAKAITDSLYALPGNADRFLHHSRPNIIMVIWESFTEKALRYEKAGTAVTPHFKKLMEEGLYFSNTYSSGDRTDKGLAAILSGYPALNKTAVIRTPSKVAGLPFLTKTLHPGGYHSSFYYGGETEFANIKSYLFSAGFHKITDRNSFDKRSRNSKWGVHDGVVMELLKRDTDSYREPFFLTWLTLTSHEPYEVPGDVQGIKGGDATSRFLNSIWYTDSVVNDLVSFCKSQTWWKNTIMIIVGDHGHMLPAADKRSDDFRIPMLWLGGALAKKGTVSYPVSQLDIGTTLTEELGMGVFSPFSRNLFSSASLPWAFFTYNNAFGFVDRQGTFVFDNAGSTVVENTTTTQPAAARAGKALQQNIFGDYLSR